MTSEQRLQRVIELGVPDRVPVAPMIYHFAARYANITMYELWFDPAKYSLALEKCFRELALPSLEQIVHQLVSRDITPVLHCDGNWDSSLEDLHRLPKGKVILQLDGRTDMFRAKEVIGDHCCLFGDVPSTMLAFGGKEEVVDYCRKLIDVVGKDGGFILAAGCEIPPNARPENVKAMIDAATQFGVYC